MGLGGNKLYASLDVFTMRCPKNFPSGHLAVVLELKKGLGLRRRLELVKSALSRNLGVGKIVQDGTMKTEPSETHVKRHQQVLGYTGEEQIKLRRGGWI